jgi:hypothetical protein
VPSGELFKCLELLIKRCWFFVGHNKRGLSSSSSSQQEVGETERAAGCADGHPETGRLIVT